MMSDVHRAICASPIPSPLNINTETMFSTTHGNPMAKYTVGTHDIGL